MKRSRNATVVFGKRRRILSVTSRRVKVPSAKAGFTRSAGFYGRYPPMGGELKFHDQDCNDAATSTGGFITNTGSLNKIAQGIAEQQRIGRKATIKAIEWNCELAWIPIVGTAAPDHVAVRVIMFVDKQCNGATAVVADLLQDVDYQSFYNLENQNRFRIIWDRTYQLRASGGAGDGTTNDWPGNSVAFEMRKRVNIPIEFSGATGQITEIRSNNIGVLIIANNNGAKMEGKVRLRFQD